MKRILSFVLCVIMIAAMLPFGLFVISVNAASASVYSEGVVDGYYTWAYDFTQAAVQTDLYPENGEQSGIKISSNGLNMRTSSYWYTDIVLKNLTEKVEITFTAMAVYKSNYFSTALGNGEEVEFTVDSSKPSAAGGSYTVNLTFDPVTGEVYNGSTLKGTIPINSETRVLRLKYTGTGNHGSIKTLTIKQKQATASDFVASFAGEGISIDPITSSNGFVVLPTAPEKDGFEFKGWSDGTNTYAAGAQVAITKDTTFTAVFEEIAVEPATKYQVTVKVDDTTVDTAEIEEPPGRS